MQNISIEKQTQGKRINLLCSKKMLQKLKTGSASENEILLNEI